MLTTTVADKVITLKYFLKLVRIFEQNILRLALIKLYNRRVEALVRQYVTAILVV